MKTCWKRRN